MNDRDRLKALLVERSIRLGEFTLASGARSSYYVDARATTMSAEGQVLIGKVAWETLDATDLDFTHVGGLTMGADPVSYAIARESWLRGDARDAFSVRKQAKEHGTGQQVEGGLPKGARCLVIEDSMTTGTSCLKAVDALRAHGAEVVGLFTLVDREQGAQEVADDAGLPLVRVYTGAELLEAARAG